VCRPMTLHSRTNSSGRPCVAASKMAHSHLVGGLALSVIASPPSSRGYQPVPDFCASTIWYPKGPTGVEWPHHSVRYATYWIRHLLAMPADSKVPALSDGEQRRQRGFPSTRTRHGSALVGKCARSLSRVGHSVQS
jgi:hypothetical protein